MTQQLIDVGAAANDRTGDTWRNAMIKTNENFTEVYGFQANNVIVINEEANFPVQDATTITLSAGVGYQIGDQVTIAKNFICNGGVMFSNSGLAPNLVFTGTGSVFTMGTGVAFEIRNLGIVAPAANIFDYNGASTLNMSGIAIFQCLDIGDFVAGTFSSLIFDNFAVVNAVGNGFSFTGAFELLSAGRASITTTSPTHKVFDLGTATFNSLNIVRVDCFGPLGSIGISGAASSANITAGRSADVADCAFDGGSMTPLDVIEPSDVRWMMTNNSGIMDSVNLADVFLEGGAETIITGSAGDWQEIGVPSAGGVSWGSDLASRFTVGTDGVITYIGERPLRIRIDGRATVEKTGGGSDVLEVRVAKNWDGTASDGGLAKSGAQTQNAQPTTVPFGALTDIVEGDDLRVIFSNTTGGSNIIATVSSMEVTG